MNNRTYFVIAESSKKASKSLWDSVQEKIKEKKESSYHIKNLENAEKHHVFEDETSAKSYIEIQTQEITQSSHKPSKQKSSAKTSSVIPIYEMSLSEGDIRRLVFSEYTYEVESSEKNDYNFSQTTKLERKIKYASLKLKHLKEKDSEVLRILAGEETIELANSNHPTRLRSA